MAREAVAGEGVRERGGAVRRLRSLLLSGLLLSNLLIFIISIQALRDSREQHALLASVTARNVAAVLGDNLSNSIARIELSIRQVVDELDRQAADGGLRADTLNAFIDRQVKRLPELEGIRVADAEGRVVFGTGVNRESGASWADRDNFKEHRDNADGTMRVTRPREGRVARVPIIGFSMRYNGRDGRFGGIVAATVTVDHLAGLLAGHEIGRYGTVILRYEDAGLIARVPPMPDVAAGQIGNRSVSQDLQRVLASGVRETSYYTASSSDGVERVFGFRRVDNAPFFVLVGTSSADYLSHWYGELGKTAVLAGGFLLLSLVLGGVSFRLIGQVERRESELDQHRQNLETQVEQRSQALLATEARASYIIAASADGLFGVDRDARILFMNPAGCAILGYTPDEVIGRHAHELFHYRHPDGSHYPADDCPAVRALRNGEKIRKDTEVYWHKDGHPIPVMYAAHPLYENGEIVGCVTSFVDISTQKAAADAKEKALLAAQDLATARREFLANMSHEIRTPLNGVLGFAAIGLRHCDDASKVREVFGKIIISGERLRGVIDDILDFSKIEAGKLSLEEAPVSVHALVAHSVELVKGRAEAKGVTLEISVAADVPAYILGDSLRLGQVLLNFLSNAVKFTETGGISVLVNCTDSQLSFSVVDTGIGMSAAEMTDLFSPFHQADASLTRRFGGTGLGLAISRRIVEMMGGDIHVTSEPGKGSTFAFEIPLKAVLVTSAEPKKCPAATEQPLAGLSILVVEDDPINQAVLTENLVADGAGIVAVDSGREAIERLQQSGGGAFDVVLMDLQLPEMDGFEATRRLRELAPDLPVIAQSAHTLAEERERCLAAGMVAHIAKPIDPDALVQVVVAHARKKAAT